MKVCIMCGTLSEEGEHVEYGLYQCEDVQECLKTYYENNKEDNTQ